MRLRPILEGLQVPYKPEINLMMLTSKQELVVINPHNKSTRRFIRAALWF